MTPSTAVRPRLTDAAQPSVAELVANELVESVYQPLVDLYSDEMVGYEALARGPVGTRLERPIDLFSAARAANLQVEVELECQRAALEGALAVGMAPGQSLFVNFEPRLLTREMPDRIAELLRTALQHFSVFVEFTERALTDRPAELLAIAQRLRQIGVGIALDDVGADPRSLALMPFLAPEVIKLDLGLLQGNASRHVAEVIHTVNAEAERTGALVLAEGIETEEQRERALALGARYGQGWLFAYPGPLDRTAPAVANAIPRPCRQSLSFADTPFGVVSRQRPVQRGDKRQLLALSQQVEAETRNLGPSAVLLSGFQEAEFFSLRTQARYSSLSQDAALVGALGHGLPKHPALGVRGIDLDQADPLRGEWDVAVIGSHFAMAFVARDLGDTGPDMRRRFDFAVTYDRDLAIEAARTMMARIAAV
jgi:EAL domain-containing protein (putative c-di-GMP-specific phosphodiesterase class I)